MHGRSSRIGISACKNRPRIPHVFRLTRQFPNRSLRRVSPFGESTPWVNLKLIPCASCSTTHVTGFCFDTLSTARSLPAPQHRVLPDDCTQTGDTGRRTCLSTLPRCSTWRVIRHQRQATAHDRDSARLGSCVTGPVFTGRPTQPRHWITGPLAQPETGRLTQPCGVGESEILAFPCESLQLAFLPTNCTDRQTSTTKRRSESPSV